MNTMMIDQWISWMTSMAWQVAVLVGLVWALSRLLGRASASLRYTLWLMIFLRLLLPPDLSVPWSLGTVFAQVPVRLELGLELPQAAQDATSVAGQPLNLDSNSLRADAGEGTAQRIAGAALPAAAPGIFSYPIMSVFISIWLFVSILLGAGMLFQWARFRNRVLQGAVRASATIEETVLELCGRMGVHRRVSVRLSDAVSTACLLGVFRPIILLPADSVERLSPESLGHVLAHELCHVRRHDLLLGWIAALLCCVYWFHPLVWLAHGYLRREREMATDDLVLRAAGEDGGRYASTIVRVAEVSRGGAPAVAGFLGAVEASENLLQRIRSVNDGARPRRMGWGSALVLLGVSLFLPMAVWTQASPPPPAGELQTADKPQTAPEIIKTSPEIGAVEVDPSIPELQVTFDQDMRGGFSWTGGGEVYPEVTGKPQWLDLRRCVLPVKLQPGKFYRVGINSKSHGNFRGVNGVSARVRALYFVTAGATDEEKQKALAPVVVTMNPANNAEGVPSQVTELTVTFEHPMGGGFSWTQTNGTYPETAGAPRWDEDKMTCHLPVKLAPNTTYALSLNSAHHINFSSEWGVPLEPVVWRFKTGD